MPSRHRPKPTPILVPLMREPPFVGLGGTLPERVRVMKDSFMVFYSGHRKPQRGPVSSAAGGYSGLHLYEEIVLGFPLPLRERDRVRGKGAATSLLIQTKKALSRVWFP